MAAVTASATASPSVTAGADIEDSNVSSPLSEMEDGDAPDADIDRMHIDAHDDQGDNSSLSGNDQNDDANKGDASESDSALSDAGSDANSEANDTEAETERLYDTPRHQRQRDVVVDQYNQGEVFEHTPSKLRSAALLNGDNEDDQDGEFESGDEASGASDEESPTKRASAEANNGEGGGRRDTQERKRKRSLVADQSESDQPLRKRTGSVGGDDTGADTPANEDDATSTNLHSGIQSGGEEDESEAQVTKKLARPSSRRKAVAAEDTAGETTGPEADGDAPDAGEDGDADPTGEDVDAEDEAEAAAKSIEEAEKKNEAFKDWSHIEEMFGIFRDRLYRERLQRLEEEEQTLIGHVPTHPEYLNMKQCLDERLAQKLQEINKEHEFRIMAHERRAVAVRAQIWSQYYQACRERREGTLESLNKQWYEVQTARRTAHSLPDYGLLFPEDPSQRVRNAIAYNTEVSTLAGLAKYEGFPAGPQLKGASPSEAAADFGSIERVRRDRSKNGAPVRDDYQSAPFPRLGPAGEQFIKDTPWANPHHSAHKFYQQPAPVPQEPGRDATSSTVRPPQPLGTATPTPTAKPSAEAQAHVQRSPTMANRLVDSPDMSRAMLNPPPHPLKGVGNIPNVSRGPRTAAA